MDIIVKINGAMLTAKQAEPAQASAIVQGFFNTLNTNQMASAATAAITIQAAIEKAKEPVKPDASMQVSAQTKQTVVANGNAGAEQQKKLPKINDSRTLHTPIAEMISKEFAKKSGMKMHGEELRYKCHYLCFACGHEGNRYVRPVTESIYCHDCQTKLAVETATFDTDEKGVPVPDQNENYYIAREEYVDDRES